MANYSKEELQYIASQVQPYLLELVKSNGLDVDSIEVVEDTDGITSLPAYDNRGGVKKVVRVPLSTFAKPAQDAADSLAESIAKADAAAENANAAAENANGVLDEIGIIKADIEKAVEDAQKALVEVQEAAATVTEKVDEINASEGAREEAEQARQEAETARVTEYGDLKNKMNAALVDMDTATESALDTANHPTYVGEDNYVYQWNKTNKVYVKTDIYVKGDDGAPGPQGPQGEKGEKGENGTGSGNVLVTTTGLKKGKTYLFTPSKDGSAEGTFVEYIVPEIDTDNVATKSDLEKKVDKVDGKQLSTEDFTTLLKKKLEGLNNYDDEEINQAVQSLQSQLNTLVSGNASKAIESFNEIVAFLNGIEDSESLDGIIAGIEQQIAELQNKVPEVDLTGLATKEDLEGKQDKVDIVDHGTEDTTFTLTPNTLHVWGEVASLSLDFGESVAGFLSEYMFRFSSGDTPTTLTLPDSVVWANGMEVSIQSGKTYEVAIIDGYGCILEFDTVAGE